MKAGLTGYAQVFGKYNTTPYDKLKLDLTYIENYSMFLDILIIMQTVKILFIKESTEGLDEGQRTALKTEEKPDGQGNQAGALPGESSGQTAICIEDPRGSGNIITFHH
jgi:hypothetical protein